MSRREARESETKRSHSKLETEPSPKKSRRDGKPETERKASRNHDFDTLHRTDQDQKHRRRLQDALPLEAPLEPEVKVGPDASNRELNKKNDEPIDGTKNSSDPTEVPRSRSFFQHDERGSSAVQGGRSLGWRGTTERGWGSDTKDRSSERIGENKMDAKNMRRRDEKTSAGDDNNVWRHDRFHELEADAPPPARKRPSFREKKVEPEAENTAGMNATESGRPIRRERPFSDNLRREERGGPYPHDLDRLEKPSTGDRALPHRGEAQRVGFSSRERFGGGGGSMGRDRSSGRYGEKNQYRPNNVRIEKWKHDLYDEANKSPSPKNVDEQIAKVEALLAS